MKMMTENYCTECDEVVHQVFDDEAFYNHTVGTITCPKCGSIVMPCNECDDHSKCGECPWNGVNGTVGMDDCDEQGLIDMLNMYAEDGLKPQQIVNKMMGVREDEETVDYAQLADDVCASYRGPLSKLDLKDSINYIVKMVAKKIGKTVDALTPQELSAIQKAAKHSVWYVSEQEELPQMESRDMILALSEYMSESWIDTGDDGDLDDIYYAVADILDKTGDYPASTSWEDCKPWCQKHYREVEARIY
jgi:hypothetical protein